MVQLAWEILTADEWAAMTPDEWAAMLTADPGGAVTGGWRSIIGFRLSGGSYPAPTTVGVEFTLPHNRMHFTLPKNKCHFTLPKNRCHFDIPREEEL